MALCSEEWVMIDANNPADSSDDDLSIIALSPTCSDVDDTDLDADDDDLYDLEIDDNDLYPPPTRPLSGLFYHNLTTTTKEPGYFAFDPLRAAAKRLIPDPHFSSFPEPVSLLASTRGLVVLRGLDSGFYYVSNPATFRRVRLPLHTRDHGRYPSVVLSFENPASAAAGDGIEHYHVVVAYNLGGGVWAFESFSSRTWEWRVGHAISVVETVVAESGVGAHGRAFWRTAIGFILCYDPETGYADEFPAPAEVETRRKWELGEMDGNLSVTCMDDSLTEVAVLYLNMERLLAGGFVTPPPWSWAGQFDGGMLRGREDAELRRSQGAAEVVMWDPRDERVVAMDFDGRITRTIGPLSDEDYEADFIPYVASRAEISSEQLSPKCRIPDYDESDNAFNGSATAAQLH
uniref:DUF1618 domain-containing protein n=1 Tax=Leersia perrieri TaxID=77586 RepID=A0A0D9Y1Q6_9ORYZ